MPEDWRGERDFWWDTVVNLRAWLYSEDLKARGHLYHAGDGEALSTQWSQVIDKINEIQAELNRKNGG